MDLLIFFLVSDFLKNQYLKVPLRLDIKANDFYCMIRLRCSVSMTCSACLTTVSKHEKDFLLSCVL